MASKNENVRNKQAITWCEAISYYIQLFVLDACYFFFSQ